MPVGFPSLTSAPPASSFFDTLHFVCHGQRASMRALPGTDRATQLKHSPDDQHCSIAKFRLVQELTFTFTGTIFPAARGIKGSLAPAKPVALQNSLTKLFALFLYKSAVFLR